MRSFVTERRGPLPESNQIRKPQPPVCSLDQSHIRAIPNCGPADPPRKIRQPFQQNTPSRHPSSPQQKCKCGNSPSPIDGFCRRCRPSKSKSPQRRVKRQKANAKRKNSKRQQHFVQKVKVQSYGVRNGILQDLKFDSYQSYLESSLWKSIRGRVLQGSPFCIRCKKTPNQVHHSTYTRENLSGESLVGLHSVCKECHEWAEFDDQGNKLSIKAANRRLGIVHHQIRQRPVHHRKKRHKPDTRTRTYRVRKTTCRCGHPVLRQGELCVACREKRSRLQAAHT